MKQKEIGYPVRHKRKVPYKPLIKVDPEVSTLNADIFRLETEMDRFILSADDYADLISEAFAENIHRSIHLEGNPLDLSDVRKITRGTLRNGIPDEVTDFPTQEIVNHVGIYILPRSGGKWTDDFVRRVHSFLMLGSSLERGVFRTIRSSIYSDSGEEIFVTCPPEHIPEEMGSLLQWLNETGPTMYPVIAGSLLFHEFESIHPFEDGNGRTGRTLFHLYLQQNGLPNSRLCLIEKEVVSDPEVYYDILTGTDFSEDYTELVHHFTRAVKRSYDNAYERLKSKDLLGKDLDEMSKRLMIKAKEHRVPFTLQESRRWIECSDFVVRKRLTELVDIGALWSEGSTKAKRYVFADPLRRILDNPSERLRVLRSTLRGDELR